MRDVAPGKINVCLLLGPTRERDGRHELVTVMQNVTLADEVELEDAPGRVADTVVCAGVEGPNLALDALTAFRERTGWDGPPQRVDIVKRIPVAAGMAGGSADAGAVLRLAATRAQIDDDALLLELAATLGADVPAQVRPGRWLALGAGEVLEAVQSAAPYAILVVPVPEPLRTPDVFREADRLGLPRDAAALADGLAAVRAALPDLPAGLCVNELEPAARSLCAAIDPAMDAVRVAGAAHVMVSGSGPTVLGFFGDRAAAETAAGQLGRPAHVAEPLTS